MWVTSLSRLEKGLLDMSIAAGAGVMKDVSVLAVVVAGLVLTLVAWALAMQASSSQLDSSLSSALSSGGTPTQLK